MNLVGKIFTVFIFLMSLVFMSFAVAVYATHQNWREIVTNQKATAEKPLGLESQLKNVRNENKNLRDEKAALVADLDLEKTIYLKTMAAATSEIKRLKDDQTDKEKKLALAKGEVDKAIAAMNATELRLKEFRVELQAKRDALLTAEMDRDREHKEVVRLTDGVHAAVIELDTLEKRFSDLQEDLQQALDVLAYNELNINSPLTKEPVPLDGKVTAVPSTDLVEISVGTDDGLLNGHQLHVYRAAQGSAPMYLGKIEVVRASSDTSVCRVGLRKGEIREKDNVTTKLN